MDGSSERGISRVRCAVAMTKVSTRHAARGASEPPKPLQRLVDVDEVAAAGVVAGLPAHSVVRLDLDAGRAGPE